MSRRSCFTLDLVEDATLIAEYEAYHAEGAVWAEVIEDIHAQGIESLEIWRVAERCVMIMEVTEDYPRARTQPKSETVERWDKLMARYQRALPSAPAGERWAPMQCIYRMEDGRSNGKNQ